MPTTGLFSGPALDVTTEPAVGVNEMVTLKPASGVLSVISVAVKVTLSDFLSVTVKEAVPVASVTAVAGDTTALTDVGPRLTVLPASGNPLVSLRSTCTVALELPSAGTVVLLATMSESASDGAVGGRVPKVTWTSSPTSGRPAG